VLPPAMDMMSSHDNFRTAGAIMGVGGRTDGGGYVVAGSGGGRGGSG
jgi:hypothetical protein